MTFGLTEALNYLFAQTGGTLFALFWYVLIFEVPRYTAAFLAAATSRKHTQVRENLSALGKVSVVIAGHNEAEKIENCVRGLYEQSRPPDEIIVVSDGSTDDMPKVIRSLLRRGLIDQAHSTELRSGKSAATNMAMRFATGDILINIDVDCSFDRHALRNIIMPLANPKVAAVSGNILPRNANKSLVATFQAIEYLISISLGKQASDMLGQVSCVSGAFGAFRRKAVEQVGGLDAGGGEDLDMTIRWRSRGWDVRFASDAVCYTDVPETLGALVRQRFRWERDAVRLRYRKHGYLLNPFSSRFQGRELFHQLEFLFYNVIACAVLPLYCIWLFSTFGEFGFAIIIAAQIGLLLLDVFTFLLAANATPQVKSINLLPFVAGYSLFNGFFMRFVRLAAYLQEWLFDASYQDTYVPDKVHMERL